MIRDSSEAKLSEDDQRIVSAIEASGRYKLWGWEMPDFCQLDLYFEDNQSINTLMGVSINTFPVERKDLE